MDFGAEGVWGGGLGPLALAEIHGEAPGVRLKNGSMVKEGLKQPWPLPSRYPFFRRGHGVLSGSCGHFVGPYKVPHVARPRGSPSVLCKRSDPSPPFNQSLRRGSKAQVDSQSRVTRFDIKQGQPSRAGQIPFLPRTSQIHLAERISMTCLACTDLNEFALTCVFKQVSNSTRSASISCRKGQH